MTSSWHTVDIKVEREEHARRLEAAPTMYLSLITNSPHFGHAGVWVRNFALNIVPSRDVAIFHHTFLGQWFLQFSFPGGIFHNASTSAKMFIESTILPDIRASSEQGITLIRLSEGTSSLNLHPLASDPWLFLPNHPCYRGIWTVGLGGSIPTYTEKLCAPVTVIPTPNSNRLALMRRDVTGLGPWLVTGDVVRMLPSGREGYVILQNKARVSKHVVDFPPLHTNFVAQDAHADKSRKLVTLLTLDVLFLDPELLTASMPCIETPMLTASYALNPSMPCIETPMLTASYALNPSIPCTKSEMVRQPVSVRSVHHQQQQHTALPPVQLGGMLELDGDGQYQFVPPDTSMFAPPGGWATYCQQAGVNVLATSTQPRMNKARGFRLQAYFFQGLPSVKTEAISYMGSLGEIRSKKRGIKRSAYLISTHKCEFRIVTDSTGRAINGRRSYMGGASVGPGGSFSQACIVDDSCTVVQYTLAIGIATFVETVCAVRRELSRTMLETNRTHVNYPWAYFDQTRTPWNLMYSTMTTKGVVSKNLLTDILPWRVNLWLKWEAMEHPTLYPNVQLLEQGKKPAKKKARISAPVAAPVAAPTTSEFIPLAAPDHADVLLSLLYEE